MDRKRILVVASGGGHWVQVRRLAPAFAGHDVTYVTVCRSYRADVPGAKFRVVHDATAWNKLGLLLLAVQMLWIVLRERPQVVISTGAAPGYFGLRFAKTFGARTVWIDSAANVEQLSSAGRRVAPYADLWLTQWEHLARGKGPSFAGAVL